MSWQEGGLPWPPLSHVPAGGGHSGDLLCWCLFFPVVSSDSDSDSDLSSSSLEDSLPPAGDRDLKGDKPCRESGEWGKHTAGSGSLSASSSLHPPQVLAQFFWIRKEKWPCGWDNQELTS